jgi:hypothetical protein
LLLDSQVLESDDTRCSGFSSQERCDDWSEAWLLNERRTATLRWDYDQRLVHISVKMRSVLLDWLFEVFAFAFVSCVF